MNSPEAQPVAPSAGVAASGKNKAELGIMLGSTFFPARRINVSTLRKHQEFLKQTVATPDGAATADMGMEGLFHMTAILHACALRADPTVTLQQIEDAADEPTLIAAFNAVMTGSGFVSGDDTPGEAPPASS